MFKTKTEYLVNVVVGKTVKALFALFSHLDKLVVSEYSQLMGNGGLFKAQNIGNTAYGLFALK